MLRSRMLYMSMKSITSDMHHHKTTCISIFSKIGLVDQSKPCTQIYLQKIASCINLQLPIVIFNNQLFETYVIAKRTSLSIFSIIGQYIATCINLQLPIVILKKSILLDMHHHETYMYINFQQNRVSRSVNRAHKCICKKMQII